MAKLYCSLLLTAYCSLLAPFAFAQSQSFVLSVPFSGSKFMQRYSLTSNDFWVATVGGQQTLFLRDGVKLPDNPPIFDAPDSPAVVQRERAKAALDAATEVVLRGIVLALVDEINKLRAASIHPLVSLTRSGSTVTATTPNNHGLSPGDTVSVFGADQAGYSGQQAVATAPTGTTFTYTIGTTPTTPATGTLIYVQGPIPNPTPQVTAQQALNAIKAKIDSGAVDQ